ncbi:MAG: rRNA maturation RNase YbeY [Bdellovibrionales bacterium]|nr:rRNA maturation RNase YbeY [Oligoflexia bacterium]
MPPKPVTQKEIEAYAITALKKWLKKAMSFSEVRKRLVALEAKTYQVDISVVSDLRMAKINHAFRKVKKPTDILSFPTHEFFQRQGVLGDLVLCGPVALQQAASMGHSWKKEIDVLLVHGILHLLHFDHETGDKDAKAMSGWEIKILGSSYSNTLISRAYDEVPETMLKTRVKPVLKAKVAAVRASSAPKAKKAMRKSKAAAARSKKPAARSKPSSRASA